MISSIILWKPKLLTLKHGKKVSYPDIIVRDIPMTMTDRDVWEGVVKSVSAMAAR